MKYIKRILFLLIVCLLFIPSVNAYTDKNLVNIYLFYSDDCSHCSVEKKLLDELEDKYNNIRIYKYEISKDNNKELLFNVVELFDTEVTGVPFTVIANKVYKGFNYDNYKVKFLATIEYYSDNGYKDIVGEYIGDIELPKYEINDNDNFNEYINNYGNYEISFLGFKINTKDFSLSISSIILGFISGFSFCNLWVLLFLIGILILIKDKKKMWSLGIIFLFIYTLIYLLFMIFNIEFFLKLKELVRLFLCLIIIFIMIFNLYRHFKKSKKNRYENFKINNFVQNKNYFLMILGIIILAIFTNIINVSYYSDITSTFMEILSINSLSVIENIIYILLYILFFLLDSLIIFFVIMIIIQVGVFRENNRLSMLISGIILLLILILLIFI